MSHPVEFFNRVLGFPLACLPKVDILTVLYVSPAGEFEAFYDGQTLRDLR